jgi:membrane fusion protein, multidrug efflux system
MDSLPPNRIDLEAPPRTGRRRTRWVMVLLCLLAVAAIVGVVLYRPTAPTTTARNRSQSQTVPVLTAAVEKRDVPILLDALGTVQAFNTVTVKTMVDGPLVAVNFAEGQMVHKGDVLARIDPRSFQAAYDQVVAKKAQDEALLANARVDLTRYQKLASNNYTSTQQADTQKALVAQYEAQVRQDQAQIDAARTNLDYTTILSPIDGRAGVRQVDQGNIVHAGDQTGLVVLTQIQPIFVVFNLPQQNLAAVTKAMAAGQPTVLAVPQGGSRSAVLDTGTLTVLDNQVDPTTGTIKMKAQFPNADNRLWPGGFVGVRLQVDTAKGAVVVPPVAVQRGPRGAYVYVVNADSTVTRVQIETGYEDETATVVTKGLDGGEKVVTDGASRLSDGTVVSLAAPPTEATPTARQRPSAPGAQRPRPPRPG